MNANSQVIERENAKVKLEVEIDGEEVKKELDNIASTYQKVVSIPGFRKGKAPLNLVKSRYKDKIEQELFDKIIPQAYYSEVEKYDFQPYKVNKIQVIHYKENEPLKFHVDLETSPEVKLPQYKDLTFSKYTYKITKKDIENELKKIQENMADYVLKENEKSEDGDIVIAAVKAYDEEGKEVEEYSVENHQFELKKEAIFEEFYKALLGKKAGDKVEVVKKYDENFHDKKLAGKSLTFKIDIKEIREKKLPQLDDEFAKDIGDYKNLEELRESIKRQLQDISEKYVNTKLEDDILDKLISEAEFTIPESLIEEESKKVMQDLEMNLLRQGQKLKDLIAKKVVNIDDVKKETREEAIKRIKTFLLLDKIAEENKIEVTEEELEEEIKKVAQQYRMKFEDLKKKIEKDEKEKDFLKAGIRTKKAIEFLKENNKIKEGKSLKFEEIIAATNRR